MKSITSLATEHEDRESNLPSPTNCLSSSLSGTADLWIYSALSLQIEHDPHWSMIAGVYLATHPSVYTTVYESVRNAR